MTERFVTLIKPEESEEPGQLRLVCGEMALELRYDSGQLGLEITERTYRDHFGKDTVWYTLDFHVLRPTVDFAVGILFKFLHV